VRVHCSEDGESMLIERISENIESEVFEEEVP